MFDDGLGFDAFEVRHLSPAPWVSQRQRIVSEAREERRRVLGQMVVSTHAAIRALGRGAGELHGAVWRAMGRYLARRRRFAELRQLSAMDDRVLRDIGVSRGEVRAALWSRDGLLRRCR